MRFSKYAGLLCLFLASGLLAVSIPSGLEVIFKNVEPGQRFHPFWPPVSGHQILGTVVIAKNPGKPKAYFQTIDSPSYRNPAYTKEFIVGTMSLDAPDLTSEKQISAGVAFSQLDAIGKAISAASSAQSLQGNSRTSMPTCKPGDQSSADSSAHAGSSPASNSATTPKGAAVKGGTAGGSSGSQTSTGGNTTNSTSAGSQGQEGGSANQKVTGFDFCRFTNAASKVTGLKVIYYDLPTLDDINSNHALTPMAEQRIAKGSNGWIIHRALVIDSIEYTLTSDKAIDAGFFAKLVAWLPTVSVGYKTQNTVTLKTTSPLTIGYKLWQRGLGVEGKELLTAEDLPKLGIGADEINTLLSKGTR